MFYDITFPGSGKMRGTAPVGRDCRKVTWVVHWSRTMSVSLHSIFVNNKSIRLQNFKVKQ